jgi:hypothetical protein
MARSSARLSGSVVSRSTFAFVLALFVVAGCGRRTSILEPAPGTAPPATIGPSPIALSGPSTHLPPAGTSCGGRGDCASDQVCVDGTCRHRETSVAGEILAAAADAQVEAGDWEGALHTYDEALAAWDAAHAPVPSDVLCHSASVILRTAATPEARERGATRADRCFRSSLPGDPLRDDVARALARLRFEGLDAALFDRSSPVDHFFTLEASRPTLDALAIDVVLPEGDESGLVQLREALGLEAARHAVGDCFEADWEVRRARDATASLVVHYQTRLVDMGTWDDYESELTFAPRTVAEEGFEPCVARALAGVVALPPRSRIVDWSTTLDIAVRVE